MPIPMRWVRKKISLLSSIDTFSSWIHFSGEEKKITYLSSSTFFPGTLIIKVFHFFVGKKFRFTPSSLKLKVYDTVLMNHKCSNESSSSLQNFVPEDSKKKWLFFSWWQELGVLAWYLNFALDSIFLFNFFFFKKCISLSTQCQEF